MAKMSANYILCDPIAQTAFSRVWTAETEEGKTVVIKSALDGNVLSHRFEREISALQLAAGRYTMPVIEFDTVDHSWYVMPLAEGTLDESTRAAGEDLALAVLEALRASLTPLHAAGQVHRDLKPANILWLSDEEGSRWVIADFGIIRNVPGSTTGQLTHAGGLLGTNGWAAPEQHVDAHAVTPAADVYAAGLITAWCWTGTRPTPTPASGSGSTIGLPESPAVQVVFQRALSHDPESRHQSLDEFHADLTRAMH